MQGLFLPMYQPILDLQTMQTSHYEALLRLSDGTSGKHTRVIALGEHFGFVAAIDCGMLQSVATDLSGPEQQKMRAAVNISAITIEHSLNDYLSVVYKNMDVINRVIFEITETARVADKAKLDCFAHAVRFLGGKIAVDDFGDGYADFMLVNTLRPEYVKYSHTIIQAISEYRCLEAINEMTRRIEEQGIIVIAEEIDNEYKLKAIRNLGIHYGQGFLLGEPDHLHKNHYVFTEYATAD